VPALAIEQSGQGREVDPAGVVDRGQAQGRAALGAQHLPRHQVRVMLQRGRDHRVTRSDVRPAPAVGDQVDRPGRAAGQHDLVRVATEEPCDLVTRGVVGLGRGLGQRVDAAVDVAGLLREHPDDRVDHSPRLERGRGAVEVCQAVAMDQRVERREIAPPRGRIGDHGASLPPAVVLAHCVLSFR
jgi:hypothetical protein